MWGSKLIGKLLSAFYKSRRGGRILRCIGSNEQEIHNFKKQTLENIQNIAGDFSKELIEKITGVAPNGSNLNAVILEISNKEKKSQYV